jgi:hypothetical protein
MARTNQCGGGCQPRTKSQGAPLLQIRQGYRSHWNSLALSVESDSGQWTLRVQDAGKILYTAHRSNPESAKRAAVEFAVFLLLGAIHRETPQLTWTAYW